MAQQQPQTAFSFDASQVAPSEGRADPIPDGWYVFAVDDSGIVPTAAGTGTYLKIRAKVQNGFYAKRAVFHNFNLTNPNAEAVEIGRGQLSAFLHAIQRLQIQQSTQETHGIYFKAKVKTRKGNVKKDEQGNVIDRYDDSNEIVSFKQVTENVPLVENQVIEQPSGPAAYAPPGGAMPWGAQAPTQMPQQPAFQQPVQQPQGGWQQPQGQQPWQQPANPAAALAASMTPQQAFQQAPPPGMVPQGGPPSWQGQPQQPQYQPQQPPPAPPPVQQQPPAQQPWNQQAPVQGQPAQGQPWANQQLPPPGAQQQPQGQPPAAAPMDPAAAAAQQAQPPWAVPRA